MAPLLFLLFIVVPIVELFIIVQVAGAIGVVETIGLLILVSVVGTWLLKQQGVAAWRRFRRTLQEERMPTDEITDGALIMFGGALLLTPGFLTDLLGLSLLFPPSRAVVRRAARRSVEQRMGGGRGRRVHDARVVRVERDATRTPPPSSAPRDDDPEALEDGSPDRG